LDGSARSATPLGFTIIAAWLAGAYGRDSVVLHIQRCASPFPNQTGYERFASGLFFGDLMTDSLKSAILSMLARVLDPLVRMMLEAGIGIGEFVTIAKIAYVRAARDEGRRAGGEAKRPNVSRIAVVTGLTRLEVASILAAGEGGPVPPDRGRQRAERVLAGWWNDSDFLDARGEPAALPLRGARRSFEALVRLYSGERWLSAKILQELLRVKAVRQLPDGRVKALSRSFATVRWDPAGITSVGEQLAEHCETLLHNLKDPGHPRFVGRVVNSRIDPRYVPVLLRDLRESAEVFLETEDSTLNFVGHTLKEQRNAPSVAGPPTRLGVTLYIFEGPGDEDRPEAEAEDTVSQSIRRSTGARSKVRRVDRRTGRKAAV
jgi:hypothetical protein